MGNSCQFAAPGRSGHAYATSRRSGYGVDVRHAVRHCSHTCSPFTNLNPHGTTSSPSGEPLVCLTAADGRLQAARTLVKSVGGAESNLAIGLARLGRRVALVTRVGDDPFGDEIVRTLRGEGVDTQWIGRESDAPTGRDDQGAAEPRRHPRLLLPAACRRQHGSARRTSRSTPCDRAARVHVTGITLALGEGPREAVGELLRHAVGHGVPVSFDPNFRLKLWSLDDAARACAAVLPAVSDLLVGEDELLAMADVCGAKPDLDGALAWLADFDLDSVVVKRGADGVVGVRHGERYEQPAHPVEQRGGHRRGR